MKPQWVLFDHVKIGINTAYDYRNFGDAGHLMVTIGSHSFEVPEKFFIEVTDEAYLIEGHWLRKKWLGTGLINRSGHPMPDGLSGAEPEAHATAWLHRNEPDKTVIHANVMRGTRLSIYLEQNNGACAILPHDLVVQHDALFEVPAWALDHSAMADCIFPFSRFLGRS